MHLRLLLILQLLAFSLYAQTDYQLFRPGVQYLYKNPNFSGDRSFPVSQFYGVRVDSLGCVDLYGTLGAGNAGMPSPCLYKDPSPFGYAICQTTDSTVMELGGDRRFVLYQGAAVGARWDTGSGLDVTAEVRSVDSTTVLGLPDQVKTIRFYVNGTTDTELEIRISQRYGLVDAVNFFEFLVERRDLVLAGMSDPAVGVQRPPAAAYGYAEVGDTFQLRTYTGSTYDNPFYGKPFQERFSSVVVTAVDSTQTDRYVYEMRGDFYDEVSAATATTPARYEIVALDTTVIYTAFRLPDSLAVLQPGAMIDSLYGDDNTVALLMASSGDCSPFRLQVSAEVTYQENEDCGFDQSQVDANPGRAYVAYVPFPVDSTSSLGGPTYVTLQYRGGSAGSCGTYLPTEDLLLPTHDHGPQNLQITIFPNPAATELNVVLPAGATYELHLHSMTGQLAGSATEVGERYTFPLGEVPAGAYILSVRQGRGIVARRRVIVH